MLKLMYISNNIEVAEIAQKNGVDRIWIDLETKGKEARQAGMNTVKSNHTIGDVRKLRPFINRSELLVRINPWDNESEHEINEVIDAGADIIMLPMWKSVNEVRKFVETVNGRAQTILLLETKEAEKCLDEVLKIDGIHEIHIGLNDLHISYGCNFMFELLANGTVERICKKIAKTNISYGFGGIGKLGGGLLRADNIITEHYRLGSSMVILSRSFCDTSTFTNIQDVENEFKCGIEDIRKFEEKIEKNYSEEDFEKNRQQVISSVKQVVEMIEKQKR